MLKNAINNGTEPLWPVYKRSIPDIYGIAPPNIAAEIFKDKATPVYLVDVGNKVVRKAGMGAV